MKTTKISFSAVGDMLIQRLIPTDTPALYYRVVVFSAPLQGHMLHCKGCCGLVLVSYRMTVPERLQPQPFTVLLIS